MTVLQQARENEGYIIGLRREFHAEPELSLKEFHTADRIEEELEKMGISHWRCRETGVYAVLKGTGEGGGTIALRRIRMRCLSKRLTKQSIVPEARRDARLRT